MDNTWVILAQGPCGRLLKHKNDSPKSWKTAKKTIISHTFGVQVGGLGIQGFRIQRPEV